MNFLFDMIIRNTVFQFKIMLTLNRTKNDLYENTNILSYYTNNTGIKGYWVREAFEKKI